MNPPKMILEACVESLEQAQKAHDNGAKRIELCSNLELDGLTPDIDMLQECLSIPGLAVKAMVRHRPGDFCYPGYEWETIFRVIGQMQRIGVGEIVFGALTPTGEVDLTLMAKVNDWAGDMAITFHKAIDRSSDLQRTLKALRSFDRVKSILTSGGAPTALEGAEKLKELMDSAGDRFHIIPAGKITHDNLHLVHDAIGAREYHGRKIVPLD